MKIEHLATVTTTIPASELTKEQVIDLQKALTALSLSVGAFDGILGPKTKSAWAKFKVEDMFGDQPELIDPDSISMLQEAVVDLPDPIPIDLHPDKGKIIQAIKEACTAEGIGLPSQIAYVLATVEWETGRTFKPVREAYWLSEEWRRQNLAKYYPYYGRGYVQLTWKANYEKYSKLLGEDLVNNPDKAMDHAIALRILVHGFKNAGFTKYKITDFINESKTDFVNARKCINALDHAEDIAEIAQKYVGTV